MAGYRIVFGPEECDEKYSAAIALLKENGVAIPDQLETSPACSDGPEILDAFKMDPNSKGAALISSYARPLLEGCGTVEKARFASWAKRNRCRLWKRSLPTRVKAEERGELAASLLKVTRDPLLRLALETRDGVYCDSK